MQSHVYTSTHALTTALAPYADQRGLTRVAEDTWRSSAGMSGVMRDRYVSELAYALITLANRPVFAGLHWTYEIEPWVFDLDRDVDELAAHPMLTAGHIDRGVTQRLLPSLIAHAHTLVRDGNPVCIAAGVMAVNHVNTDPTQSDRRLGELIRLLDDTHVLPDHPGLLVHADSMAYRTAWTAPPANENNCCSVPTHAHGIPVLWQENGLNRILYDMGAPVYAGLYLGSAALQCATLHVGAGITATFVDPITQRTHAVAIRGTRNTPHLAAGRDHA